MRLVLPLQCIDSTLTIKKESPGPNTRDGRKIVALGQAARTACSPRAFVRGEDSGLFGSAPIALRWMSLAFCSRATTATFSAPFH